MLSEELKKVIKGEVKSDDETLTKYSRDASLFEIRPEVVVFPKDVDDVKSLVRFASSHKGEMPKISLTARSGGTDMTGGCINDSIILDFTKHFTREEVDTAGLSAVVEPGVFYRNFEEETLPAHVSLPSYPASKSIAALGGMIMNNSGGERTLRYGQTRNFVTGIKMVLSDGNEYLFEDLDQEGLDAKLMQKDFEGEVYRKMHDLLESNYELVQHARPKVSKNSAGYALWDVWNRERFRMTQLFVGSQGTLGIMTEAQLRLVPSAPHRKLVVMFFKSWDALPQVVNALLPFDPESLEAFDDATLKLGLRFMPEIAKKAHSSFLRFAVRFLPEVWIGLKMGGLPKLIVLAELAEEDERVLDEKVHGVEQALEPFPVEVRTLHDAAEAEKYWVMRRESFSLLRKHVKGKRTAPFVDDFCVAPDRIPEFLPRALKILKQYGIRANIAGHAGNGNFHIIPLMDFTDERERAKIFVVAGKIYDLVAEFGGSITAEHNDGLIRTPYLETMFGAEVCGLFREVKQIFDPQNIFNPHKKVGTTVEYAMAQMAKR